MKSRLAALEAVIESERRRFYKVGKALGEIRDCRLYRELLYESFEQYVRKRWDMGRSHAYRMIEASAVIDNLSPIGDRLPENEAQLRPLSRLKPADQRRLWQAFLSAGLTPTACNIGRFVANVVDPQKPRIDLTHVISPSYKVAVMAMLREIGAAREDGWRATSREAGLLWLSVMREKILSKG